MRSLSPLGAALELFKLSARASSGVSGTLYSGKFVTFSLSISTNTVLLAGSIFLISLLINKNCWGFKLLPKRTTTKLS